MFVCFWEKGRIDDVGEIGKILGVKFMIKLEGIWDREFK